MRSGIPWRERRWLWLFPLFFLLANTGLLSMYRAVYAGRVQQLKQASDEQAATLGDLEGQRLFLEEQTQSIQNNRDQIRHFYQERLATEKERMILVIREIRELAGQAGLQYQAASYPEEQIQSHKLVKMSFIFTVQGDYVRLRRLINLLDHSDSFLILQEIRVSETGDSQQLKINLHISTLFAEEGQEFAGAGPAAAGVDS